MSTAPSPSTPRSLACSDVSAHISLALAPSRADAGAALAAITNAQLRGQPPLPAAILSLVALALRSPAQHSSGRFWGVAHAAGSAQLNDAARLAVFGAALQSVIDDLLTGGAQARCSSSYLSKPA